MAGVEAVARGIPDFGPVVRRKHILNAARFGCPALTVVCAPPGYGKSVLAAQLARESRADTTVWISLYDADLRGDEWLGRLADALSADDAPRSGAAGLLSQLDPNPACSQALLRIRDALALHVGRVVDIQLDGANRVGTLGPFEDLARLLRRCTSAESTLTLTCRHLAGDEYVPDPTLVWLIGGQELTFDSAEVLELLLLSGDVEEDEGVEGRAARLLERFSGHPAITSLMVRHSRIDDSLDPPQDLVWYIRRLVSQLADDALLGAYGAAMFRQGLAIELDDCLHHAGLDKADWSAMLTLAPLLKMGDASAAAGSTFAMHAVLCETVITESIRRLSSDSCGALRASVLVHMTRSGDLSRVPGTLLAACTGEEVSAWCECHGLHLLYRCGAPMLERCLTKVEPLRLASSARLLLLRSAALREQERTDEALTHAVLAQRLAEADGDLETQTGAVLLEVRLSVDAGNLPQAGRAVRRLQGPLWADLSAPAACLVESYAAWLDTQAGDFDQAYGHLASAIASLEALGKSCQEAAWAANVIAGVNGLLLGRWSEVGALLMAASGWAGTAPPQALQCRANAAVAYLEMGSIREAELLLGSVRKDAADAGLPQLGAYATTTLAEARWIVDRTESCLLWEQGDSVLIRRGDFVGPTMGHVQKSALCRAIGSGEEALAHAEAAITSLQEAGDVVRLLHLSAETEVAASILALGDRWGARRVASRVAEELHGTPANAHLLLVHLILAELDRLEGDVESAVTRLHQFEEYVSTGSANWRMAMYLRAFPGLLGPLVQAFGAGNLPLRMLRLVPEDVIEAACDCGAGSISPEDRQVVLARSRGGEDLARVQIASPPTCTVRFFGGFEVAVDGRVVEDSHWRKRKVRLLFAMLAAGRGQEIPRDVILERLWPGMEEDRARRNFYVTWSAMKRALSSGSSADITGRYALCSSGVCRVTRAVRSDLDEFSEAIEALRAANAREDITSVLVAARRLLGVYTGDLLPGDVYEEWFTDARERAKHEFCDAMLVAAEGAEAQGNTSEALAFLRKAGVVDPWREDIYQTTMRCQIGAGQRSRAIETYMACRGRLVDDLGIDPSMETTRLYEAVLAMDSETCDSAPAFRSS